jgi:hypothetical protein
MTTALESPARPSATYMTSAGEDGGQCHDGHEDNEAHQVTRCCIQNLRINNSASSCLPLAESANEPHEMTWCCIQKPSVSKAANNIVTTFTSG